MKTKPATDFRTSRNPNKFHYHSMLLPISSIHVEDYDRQVKHAVKSSMLFRYFICLLLSYILLGYISSDLHSTPRSSFSKFSLSNYKSERHVSDSNNRVLSSVSSSKKVRTLYGNNAVVLGYDECINSNIEIRGNIVPIGLPGSGNELLSSLFGNNCQGGATSKEYKYIPAALWNKIKKESLIPVVIVQDPLQWLYAICKSSSYPDLDISWNKAKDRCPNIVANSYDIGFYPDKTVDIQLHWNSFNTTQSYKSLIDLYLDFYNDWIALSKSLPKVLFVRLEDLLFHNQEQVISNICTCSRGTVKKSYKSIHNPSLVNGTALDLVDTTLEKAVKRYTSTQSRAKHLIHDYEIEYVKEVFNGKGKDFMDIFHYSSNVDELNISPLGLFRLN